MADVSLSNSVSVTGTYDLEPLLLVSNTVATKIVKGITVHKTADKEKWATGNLTYTITIENNADNPFETPTLVDVLDTNLITLVENSVLVDGVTKEYIFEKSTGTLSINLETIAVGGSSVITFRVQQK